MPKRKGIRSIEDLREELECPVCLVAPTKGPVYQCDSGHIHCHSCRPGLQECPTCRGPIGDTRALKVEQILAMLPTKCAFTEYGCLIDEKLPEDMRLHEKECQFRLVKCYDWKCKEYVPVSDYVDHCLIKHNKGETFEALNSRMAFVTIKSRLSHMKTADGGWKKGDASPRFIKTRNHTFVVRVEFDQQGFMYVYIFILGSQRDIDAEEYYCKVSVKHPKKNFKIQHDRGLINVIDDNEPVPILILHQKQWSKFLVDEDAPYEEKKLLFRFAVFIGSSSYIERDDLTVRDADCTEFVLACDDGNEAKVDRMLKDNTEVQRKINDKAQCGMNGFMIACRKGYTEIVSMFLKKATALDLDITAEDHKNGQTGLTMAVLGGHLEIVKLLTKEPSINVNLNTSDDKLWRTPFMYACQLGFKDIVAYFLKLAESKKRDSFDLNKTDGHKNTAFHLACLYERDCVVDLIMDSIEKLKIDTTLKNQDGKTGFDLWPDKFEDENAPRPAKRPRILYSNEDAPGVPGPSKRP